MDSPSQIACWLGALCAVLAPAVTAAEPCRPTARVSGDPALADSLGASLAARGIETVPAAGCPHTKVQIAKAGSTIVVAIEDPYGRKSERTFVDAAAAVPLVESWVRQDVNAQNLMGWTVEPKESPVTAPATVTARADATPLAPGRHRDVATLVVAADASIGFDGSTWVGAHALGCVRLGVACVGALGRVSREDTIRQAADVLASLEVPFSVGRMQLVPGVAVGGGWIALGETTGEGARSFAHIGVRFDAHLALAYPLSRLISLHAGVSIDASLTDEVPRRDDGTSLVGPEPLGFVRANLGLRIGVP